MSKSKKLHPSLHYNEDENIVTLIIMSGFPIKEKEFIAALYDWLKAHKDGFKYEDIGELVDFDMMIDEDYDGSPRH